ncbi:MAG TPA: hypothetical protein VKC90_06065 [Chitinophagaceae bacterium]|nr:hypothetical protein [Chitinophagaceae bacterium]
MKKIIVLLAGLLIFTGPFASVKVIHPRLKASEMFFPVGNTGQKISLLELSRIKVKDLQLLTGHKMDIFDRLSFTMAQKKVRNMINRDGTISTKRIEKFTKSHSGETGFHIGGFALGFFLGLIGVLIAYLINDDYKHNRVKWAWIGWGTFVVLYVILIVALINNNGIE